MCIQGFQLIRRKSVKKLTSFLFLFFFVAGCARPEVTPTPQPRTSILIKEQDKILAEIERHRPFISSLQGTAKVEMYRQKLRVAGKQEIAIKTPGYMYVETINPFGSMVSLLVADNSSLKFYDSSTNKLYTGRPVAGDLSKLFPIYLDVSEVVNLALYQTRIPPCDRRLIYFEQQENWYRVICINHRIRREFWVDPTDFFLWKQVLYVDDQLQLKITYKNVQKIGEGVFPYETILDFPPEESAFVYKWSEIDINPDIPKSKFTIPQFENVEKVNLAAPLPME